MINDVAVKAAALGKLLIPGQDFVHEFDEANHRFRTLRKIHSNGA